MIVLGLVSKIGHMCISSAGKGRIRSRGSGSSRTVCYASRYSVGIVESVAMDENGADTPEQVLKFVPTERPRSYAPLVEEAEKPSLQRFKSSGCARFNCRVREL